TMKVYLRKQAEKHEKKDTYLLNGEFLSYPNDEDCLNKIIYRKSQSFRVYKNFSADICYFISLKGLVIEFFPNEYNSYEKTTVIFYADKLILTNSSWETIFDSLKNAKIQNGEAYIKQLTEDYKLILLRLSIKISLLILIIITLWILIKK